MDQLTFDLYLDAEERDVFAVQIDEALQERILYFPFIRDSFQIGDYLMFSSVQGGVCILPKVYFEHYHHKPGDVDHEMSQQESIRSRSWLVQYEIKDVEGVQSTRHIAPRNGNTGEDVLNHFMRSGASRVISMTKLF